MERPDYDSPSSLKALLTARGFTMQKKFGQNFLVNKSAREKIVSLLGAKPGETIWEIGPGLGSMTSMLLDTGINVTAFEIDHGFIDMLKEIFGNHPGFTLLPGDVLKTWETRWKQAGTPDYIFGNLPYNIAGAIIGDFVEFGLLPKKMLFMVQKESADRMRASVDSESYSSFSVLCQSAFSVKSVLDLKPGSFWPMPEVTSSVVSMEPRKDFPPVIDRPLFLKLLRALFATRRKTIKNNLKPFFIPLEITMAALESTGITPDRRAETLSPEKIAEFSNAIARAQEQK